MVLRGISGPDHPGRFALGFRPFVSPSGAAPAEIYERFAARELDLAITVIEGNPPDGCRAESLLPLPLTLLAGPEVNIEPPRTVELRPD